MIESRSDARPRVVATQTVTPPYPSGGTKPRARVLFVDDDEIIRSSLGRRLGQHYELHVAASGAEALDVLKREGPFAVVLSDLQMPGMDGIALLAQIGTRSPETVRVLITAHAALDTAIEAVNEGGIFRLLTKPCMPEKVRASIDAGVTQYRLIMAERELLRQTLRGAVDALVETLALANPLIFGRGSRVKQMCIRVAREIGADSWEIEVAAMLAQVGAVSLPSDVLDKLFHGEVLTDQESQMVARIPATADELLAHVPRLEGVREIIRLQNEPYSTGHTNRPPPPLGARVLKAALDLDALQSGGASASDAIEIMQGRPGMYDPDVLMQFATYVGVSVPQQVTREVRVRALEPGMRLMEDVRTTTGLLLIPRGYEVNAALVERIRNLPAAVTAGFVWAAIG